MPYFECRICGKRVVYQRLEDVPTAPFCSERCRLIDLGKWLDGEHVIEGEEDPEDDNEDEDESSE